MIGLLERIESRKILISYSNDGHIQINDIQDLVRANFTLTSADWEIHTNTRPTNYRKWLHRIQGVLAEYKRKYTTRAGTKITKWRCGSCNKTDGHKVCSNRYVTDETFTKLFVMGWNEIAEHPEDYQEKWEENIKSDDVLLRYKTRLLMKYAVAGSIKEFDSTLMMAVMNHITVYEDGRLKIRFYDETEFEVATE